MRTSLSILYHDQDLVVVDKPAGLLAVPGRGEEKQDSVESRIRALFPGCPVQPAAHRLDMDTSGLMVLALNRATLSQLMALFREQRVEKRYLAVLDGVIAEESGRIELAFRLDPENRPRQVYDPVQGKPGLTFWRRLGVRKNRTRVLFEPRTGRTHQLRLHAAHALGLAAPIVGDRLYGRRLPGERMLLHGCGLSFVHPGRSQRFCFFSSPPF